MKLFYTIFYESKTFKDRQNAASKSKLSLSLSALTAPWFFQMSYLLTTFTYILVYLFANFFDISIPLFQYLLRNHSSLTR